LLAALRQRDLTGKGQYVEVAMMDGVMNLCRVKFRDHQRLARQSLAEYSVPTYKGMGEVPRAGNDSGGGQLGNAVHCKPHGANDWLYVVVQEGGVGRPGEAHRARSRRSRPVGRPACRHDRRAAQESAARLDAAKQVRREIHQARADGDPQPARRAVRADHVTEDLATDEHVRGRDMWVELDHPQRGKWWNVGMPIKLSDSPAQIERSPLLGEHTDEVLKEVLGYDEARIKALLGAGAFSVPPKKAA
jgi:formyl-CoA transferase